MSKTKTKCPDCTGGGVVGLYGVLLETCSTCDGFGTLYKSKKLTTELPVEVPVELLKEDDSVVDIPNNTIVKRRNNVLPNFLFS